MIFFAYVMLHVQYTTYKIIVCIVYWVYWSSATEFSEYILPLFANILLLGTALTSLSKGRLGIATLHTKLA